MSLLAGAAVGRSDAGDSEVLELTVSPPLSHDIFEKLWLELQVSHQQSLEFPRPSTSPETLNAAFQLVKIQVLACSRSDAHPWRLYMYSRSSGGSRGQSLILAELLEGGAGEPDLPTDLTLFIKQKPEQSEVLSAFVSIIRNILQTFSSHQS